MREIMAYQCSDGLVFTNEKTANDHEDDLFGQELDGLLRLFDLNLSRNQEHQALLKVMTKRQELRVILSSLSKILDHRTEAED